NARLSRKLATIDVDSPVDLDPTVFHLQAPDVDQLTTLLSELEFTTLLRTFQPASSREAKVAEFELIADKTSAQRFVEPLPKNGPLGVHCLCSGKTGMQATVQGIGLSTGSETGFVPLDIHPLMQPIVSLLHDADRTKVIHDLKATVLAFQRVGLTLPGPCMDT